MEEWLSKGRGWWRVDKKDRRGWSESGWKEDVVTLLVMEYGGKVVEGQEDGGGSMKRIDEDGGRK
jgi:hypothetical protein